MKCHILPLTILSLSLITSPLFAQDTKTDPVLTDLSWRNIGPAIMGGRIDDLAVVESDPKTYYVATAAGGIFKTSNNGTTFESIFDGYETSSIGDIAIAPSDPNIVYVGSGEANNRQSSSWGYGMYKSDDAGKTWKHLGLEKTQHIGRVVVHPKDPNTLYVAALGKLWGANPERGLYKSTDGGKSWTKSLYINEDTGVTDVAMDPKDPNTLYAAAYTRRRSAFGFVGGSSDGGLYKTTDAGKTWKKLSGGLPGGEVGRIGIAIYPKNPKIVYVTWENDNKGGTQSAQGNGNVWRTDDGGENWEKRAATNPRPMYFSQIRVDPNDEDTVYVTGVNTYMSVDGAKTFTSPFSRVHADGHALWINPADSDHLLFGCDGGIQVSWDQGKTWDFINTIVISQFYEVHYDMRLPYHVYGGLQDNGTWEAPSRTLDVRGVTNDEWLNVGGGDGFYAQADPLDWRIIYTESQGGAVGRRNQATGESKSIRPRAETPGERLQFDWNSPILISPHNNKKLFFGGNKLFISLDRGDTWRRTDDLTTKPDRTKLPILGKPVGDKTLSGNDGQDGFGYIVTVTESPVKEGVIWAGTDDGNVQVSQDDGKTWTLCTVPGVPKGTYVSRVHASSYAAGRCYVSFDGHRSDDFTPYAFVTEDFGATWKKLTSSLPEGATVSVIREHPRASNLLVLGTERGAYVSFNRGGSWERFDKPFPASIPVDDIQIHPRDNDLIFATHARGIWILDDIGALEAKALSLAPVTLAPPKPAVHYRIASRKATTGHKIYVAPNPTTGSPFRFYLGENIKGAATLTVKDSKGKVVRTLSQAEPATGWNLLRWDIRENSATPGQGGGFGGATAPRLLPGSYTATLTVANQSSTQPLMVFDDPRVNLTDKERKEVHDTLAKLRDTYGELDAARASLTTKRTALEKEPASPKRDGKIKAITELLAQIAPAGGGNQGQRGGGGGQGQRGGGAGGNAPANRRTPATLRGGDPQAGNRPPTATPPTVAPAERSGESAAEGQPTPRPQINPNLLTTRLSRVSQNIDALSEPLSPGYKREAEEAIKAAKKVIGEAKKLK
jgi:photosystem II stability/assembly factor-like uncharacterized protein